MSYDEFVAKYNGKSIDFDHYAGAQCVDLYRQYCAECLQVPQSPPTGNSGAKTLFTTYLPEYFTQIKNTPLGVPQKGDIVIWGFYPGVTGWAGHVAIFDHGDVNSFVSFDQNYPTGSACHLQTHNYRGVLGWLHKR